MTRRDPTAVIHVPHASTVVPDDVREQYVISHEELMHEVNIMTDHFTDRLFETDLGVQIRFPVSRIVVDPERFEDDDQEVMAARGMGAIYSRTAGQEPLRRNLKPRERERLLEAWYRPHHAALTAAVNASLETHGQRLVIDAHSFPAKALPYELHQSLERPDICLGTDDFHTPAWLEEHAVHLCSAAGWTVDVNRSFAGALVPARYYRADRRVRGIMIEVNRRLYLDEHNYSASPHFMECRERLEPIINELIRAAGIHPA